MYNAQVYRNDAHFARCDSVYTDAILSLLLSKRAGESGNGALGAGVINGIGVA